MAKKPSIDSIDFSKPMHVIRVGKRLRKPYHKKPFLYVDKSSLVSEDAFIEYLAMQSRNWDNGTYILKAAKLGEPMQGSTLFFAQFDLVKGEVENVPKESPSSGRSFLCWDFFEKE